MSALWSPDEHTTFLNMVNAGKKSSEIAAALPHRTRNAVLNHGKRYSIRFSQRPLLFTKKEDKKLTGLIKQALSWAKIGKALGKDESSIRSAASRLGLTKEWSPRYAPIKPKPKHPARKCLRCGGSFRPIRVKIFICTPCKSTTDWQDGQWMQEMV